MLQSSLLVGLSVCTVNPTHQVASLLNSHEDKIFKLREKFEEKKRTALTDLERDLLEERKQKYRQAIAAPDVPVRYILVSRSDMILL